MYWLTLSPCVPDEDRGGVIELWGGGTVNGLFRAPTA